MTFSLPTLLGVLFIALKLCDVIAWSWLWVLAPFWLPAAVVLGLMLIMLLGCWITDAIIALAGR